MSDAYILDAIASTLIENVCNNFEEDLRCDIESKGLFLADRFSPGYGDYPLDVQGDILQFLCHKLFMCNCIYFSFHLKLIHLFNNRIIAVQNRLHHSFKFFLFQTYLSLYLFHRLTFCKFINHLIKITDFLH